eukprot:CAMPEP_0182421664 /NCGR_PEP_ID=MMETSP1167-20130531/7110_1 /TAXON_ID=2988 /ORGANISM="Mallomonas Sp, Strain CCMP3275" /LENGTH=259 /DNA_ID=CAMNT_0024599013 /DNA_START=276 /DNA_END=1055 /DNA_ORIENTATION=-
MTAWVQTDWTGVVLMSLGRSPYDNDHEVVFYISYFYNGLLGVWDYGDDGYGFDGYSTIRVDDNQLNHIAFVKDHMNGYFYVNGQPAGELRSRYSVEYRNSDFVIGKDYRQNSAHFDGVMEGVRVYQGSLLTEEIYSLYMDTKPSDPSLLPSPVPSVSFRPSNKPTLPPSDSPTGSPSSSPSFTPSLHPTYTLSFSNPSKKPKKTKKPRRKRRKRRNRKKKKKTKRPRTKKPTKIPRAKPTKRPRNRDIKPSPRPTGQPA